MADSDFPASSVKVCASAELVDGGDGVRFDVDFQNEICNAFVVRFDGQVKGFLNRCPHVDAELDWMPGKFFDSEGCWLVCASHGALFDPASGDCVAGPAKHGLMALRVQEHNGNVVWIPQPERGLTVPASQS